MTPDAATVKVEAYARLVQELAHEKSIYGEDSAAVRDVYDRLEAAYEAMDEAEKKLVNERFPDGV